MRFSFSFFVTIFCCMPAMSAEDQTVAIDFGPKQQSTVGWNNVTTWSKEGLVLEAALDLEGTATSLAVRQVDAWAGFNINGHSKNRPFPATAKRDSFYLERGVDTQATFRIEGLTPDQKYQLTLFASRMGDDQRRVGRYTINEQALTLNAHNNTAKSVTFADVQPDQGGAIILEVTCDDEAMFAYLGLLTITGSFGAPTERLHPPDPLDGPPVVSAKAWAIADGKTGEVLWGGNESSVLQMASTTKIMTAWIVLDLAKDDDEILDQTITISKAADKTGGSTADVREGEEIAVGDLLFGLLLPSGNDAAVALGEHFGRQFHDDASKAPGDLTNEESLALFVKEMNRRAEELGMKETRYLDPHGNSANRSSARDLIRLAWTSMQNKTFQEYVKTRRHRCRVKIPGGSQREVVWKNTNQLLEIEGYDGVKTGTTGGAGACLVSSGHRGDGHLLVVVLGSTSRDGRYVDSRNLYRWAWKERGHK